MSDVFELQLGGRKLSVEIGKVAKQASGAALVRYGETMVLVTACASKEPRQGISFFPLTVDYEERFYSAGKIPGGFIKREGRPSERAILSARLIDRPIRPLFPKGFRNDVHIVATVMSVDHDNTPEIPAMIGASIALTISDIPFGGPIAGVKVGRINGEFMINPTSEQMKTSDIELTVAGTSEAIMMVEAGAKEVPEDVMLDAIMAGHEAIKKITAWQEEIGKALGKPKMEAPLFTVSEEIEQAILAAFAEDLETAFRVKEKKEREEAIDAVKEKVMAHFAAQWDEGEFAERRGEVGEAFHKILKKKVRKLILEEQIRPDGRKPDEIRPISCEIGILPRAHGSGLFTRGQTQALSVTTLGTISDEQILDGLGVEESKRYMHHYNFPPYSVGETGFMRGPGRREIGHGALGERALLPVIPNESEFPYTIRVVSDILESNGSSSQASICGSTISLMHAGVPIKAPVSGIAMGLIKEDDEIEVLSDIQGMEDALGDMDFKVAGTAAGVTALQMDIKVGGVSREILERALKQAKEGRMFILGKMLEVIDQPRENLSPYAPRIITMDIDPDKIRAVIGPGGKIIKKIVEETGVKIDIEDDGRVFIASVDGEAGDKAKQWIERLTADVKVGSIYMGTVTRIMNFGAFVEILPGKEGLVHISKLDEKRVNKVEDVVAVGDEILVKVTEIDNQGRVNLSRRDAMREQDKKDKSE